MITSVLFWILSGYIMARTAYKTHRSFHREFEKMITETEFDPLLNEFHAAGIVLPEEERERWEAEQEKHGLTTMRRGMKNSSWAQMEENELKLRHRLEVEALERQRLAQKISRALDNTPDVTPFTSSSALHASPGSYIVTGTSEEEMN